MQKILILLVLSLLVGCSGQSFQLKSLVKTDIDMVADIHYEESQRLLKELTAKLYKRNPNEWRKSGLSLEKRTAQLFDQQGPLSLDELNGVTGVKAIELALDSQFLGDRVFALIAGLNHMIRQSYDFKAEFFIFSELDGQRLYHSARNLEIAVWRLSNRRADNGSLLLLSNNLPNEIANLSFERLFGKLIANQDMLASIVAQKNQRVIKTVAQNVAAMVFFPI